MEIFNLEIMSWEIDVGVKSVKFIKWIPRKILFGQIWVWRFKTDLRYIKYSLKNYQPASNLMDGQRGPTLEVPYTSWLVNHQIGPTPEVPWYFEATKHKNTHHQRHDVRILSTPCISPLKQKLTFFFTKRVKKKIITMGGGKTKYFMMIIGDHWL